MYKRKFQMEKTLQKCKVKQKQSPKRCSWKKVFWKYAVNLQKNTHAKVRFQ